MRGIARIGDKCKGTCRSHRNPIEVEGIIVSGSPDCFINGRAIARIGDKVISSCGHEGIIVSGSPDAFVNGRGHARLGDKFEGAYSGIIISSATDGF